MSKAVRIRVKWLSDFCVIDEFQFQKNERYELPVSWQEWAVQQATAGKLEILSPEEIKVDVQA